MRKICISILIFILTFFVFMSYGYTKDYGRRLTSSEREQICSEIKAARTENATSAQRTSSLGGGIIPDSVLANIYNTTRDISESISFVLVLGHALTCNAVHANSWKITILGVQLMKLPNIPVWLCGAIIYFFGFMLTLSVTFYLVDIAFKLGFAVIMLPIGVALWPFPITKDKLSILISIMLKNAAIFVFLALTVSYGLNLIGEAGGGLEEIFDRIDKNETDSISRDFSLASTNFLIVLFALVYSMKLIGSAITDYADKFFPDKAFGGGQSSSPIHGSLTQAMDFAKKKTVDPVASWGKDVAKTQMGKATVGAGKLMTGQYNKQILKAAYYATNPKVAIKQAARKSANMAGNIAAKTANVANKTVVGGLGRILLGKKASQNLKNSISQKINNKQTQLNSWASQNDAAIDQSFNNSKVMTAAKNVKKALNKVDNIYQKTLNTLDKASTKVNGLLNPIKNKVNNICQKIDANTNQSTRLGKAKAKIMKAGVKTAGFIANAPLKMVSIAANVPIKVTKLAVKLSYVKNWTKTTGSLLQSVGDKMQRNKKTPEMIQREAQQRAKQEYERELEEMKQQQQSSVNSEDNYN